MSDNDFIILDEEEKKDPKGDGAEKEENHELTASGHEDKEDNDNENEYEKIVLSVIVRRALQAE